MPGKSTIKHKVCRALGVNLIGSPSAALTLSRRPNRPGQHGASRQAKISPFGQQLRETQKLKAFYGIGSKQLRRYYEKAARVRKQTNVALVQTLETRLDKAINLKIFKSYDIRGEYPEQLNEHTSEKIGIATVQFLKGIKADVKNIVVARDIRLSSESLARSLMNLRV